MRKRTGTFPWESEAKVTKDPGSGRLRSQSREEIPRGAEDRLTKRPPCQAMGDSKMQERVCCELGAPGSCLPDGDLSVAS